MNDASLIGIDLFAGAGGLSYGLSNAGFDMKLGIEIDPNSAATLKRNNKNMTIVQSDIRSVDPVECIKNVGIQKGDIDLIAGGPPCQGFSKSNHRTRCADNPLNDLYKDFFRFVKQIKPQIFLLENVAGLKTLQKGEKLEDILKIGSRLGYHVKWDIVNAEYFGVPQRRNRIIFIGTKKESNGLFKFERSNTVTVRDSISDLPVVENGNEIDELEYSRSNDLSRYQKKMRQNKGKTVKNNLVTKNGDLVVERYHHIPQGGNWKDIPTSLMHNYKNASNCHRWIYYRLKWDEPSVVVSNFRKNMLIHPEQHRGLSVREAARLQSFPDDYIFCGTKISQQQQVANAVPPILAEKIGIKIIDYKSEGK